MGVMQGWPRLLPVDYLAPAEPSFVSLAQGTTSNNFDFGPATGGLTNPTPPTASYKVNTGTLTLGSVTWTGTAWRVPVSGMSDGISGTIKLSFRASDGQITSQIVGFRVAPAPTTDYIAPAAPAAQSLAVGITTANVDFGPATGQTTSGTPSASYRTNTGTVTLGAVSWTGSAWRVPISGMSDGQAVEVELDYTASDGQITSQCGIVAVGASVATAWQELFTLDLTQADGSTDVAAQGSHSIPKSGGGTLCTINVNRTSTNEPTKVATIANGVGLSLSQVSSSAQSQTAYWAIQSTAIAALKPDKNQYYIELLCSGINLQLATSAALHWYIADAGGTAGDGDLRASPAFGGLINALSAGTDWETSCRKHDTTATTSSGQNESGTEPAVQNFGIMLYGGIRAVVYRGVSATFQGPASLPSAYVGDTGTVTKGISDTEVASWTSAWIGLFLNSQNVEAVFGSNTVVLSKIRVWCKSPETL